MKQTLKTVVHDYGWIHTTIGLAGNLAFFAGSILFLPALESLKVVGVWLFIAGSFLMFVGALGNLLARVWEREHGE